MTIHSERYAIMPQCVNSRKALISTRPPLRVPEQVDSLCRIASILCHSAACGRDRFSLLPRGETATIPAGSERPGRDVGRVAVRICGCPPSAAHDPPSVNRRPARRLSRPPGRRDEETSGPTTPTVHDAPGTGAPEAPVAAGRGRAVRAPTGPSREGESMTRVPVVEAARRLDAAPGSGILSPAWQVGRMACAGSRRQV